MKGMGACIVALVLLVLVLAAGAIGVMTGSIWAKVEERIERTSPEGDTSDD